MDPKPGYLTTEFWTTNLVHLITVVVLVMTALGNHSFDGNKLQPLVPVAAMLASGIAQAYYSHSRGHVKVAANSAAADILTTQAVVASGGNQTVTQSATTPLAVDATTTVSNDGGGGGI